MKQVRKEAIVNAAAQTQQTMIKNLAGQVPSASNKTKERSNSGDIQSFLNTVPQKGYDSAQAYSGDEGGGARSIFS